MQSRVAFTIPFETRGINRTCTYTNGRVHVRTQRMDKLLCGMGNPSEVNVFPENRLASYKMF
jgi:hypothetical protein